MHKSVRFAGFALLMLPAQLTLAETSATTPAAEVALAATFGDAALKWVPCPPFIPKGCEIAVLHGDPSKPNVDVFFKVPENFTIPRHTHTSAERMVLVSGELTVSYEGQAPTVLKTGSYAYGPAKLPHSAVCAKGAPCVLFIAFESPMDAIPTVGAAK
jgi:quercetin dioxygenase-like cupin family protein